LEELLEAGFGGLGLVPGFLQVGHGFLDRGQVVFDDLLPHG
jgi:hypothetical protein